MTNPTWSRQIAALTPYLRGTTIELGGAEHGLLPSTTPVRGPDGTNAWERFADDSADAIVGLGVAETFADPVGEIRQWCRVLREGGTLALTTARSEPPSDLIALINHVGGLEIVGARCIEEEQHWLLVAERTELSEIRSPLGALGPRLAEIASRDRGALAELYFQFGTILLQGGDPELASQCFTALQKAEGRSSDGLFGLGMCHATAARWREAVADLEQARQLDPGNEQVQRWLALAQSKLDAAKTGATPAPTVTPS